MALSLNEAIFVKAVVLHGNKLRAVREAFCRLEKGFEQAAITYMMQNPEVSRHIDAGVLYIFKQIVTYTEVAIPQPLTTADKKTLLELIINGTRETPAYIMTSEGLRMIFVKPGEDEIEDAKRMLKALQVAEQMEWMM